MGLIAHSRMRLRVQFRGQLSNVEPFNNTQYPQAVIEEPHKSLVSSEFTGTSP